MSQPCTQKTAGGSQCKRASGHSGDHRDGCFEWSTTGFVKNDAEKTRLDLLPVEALEAIGQALTVGARKYSDENWRQGAAWSRYYAAALRHLFAWKAGEDNDPETGLSHLAHAGACVCILIGSAVCGLGTDDRWRKG